MYTHTAPQWLHDADNGLLAVAHITRIDSADDDGTHRVRLVDGSTCFVPAAEVARLHRPEPIAKLQGRPLYGR